MIKKNRHVFFFHLEMNPYVCLFLSDWTRVPCPQSQLSMGQHEGRLMPANVQPVLPCRALLLASQQRPLLRAVPNTRPHQDQQYSHWLITDRQTDRQVYRHRMNWKAKWETYSNGYRIIFSAFVYILLFLWGDVRLISCHSKLNSNVAIVKEMIVWIKYFIKRKMYTET